MAISANSELPQRMKVNNQLYNFTVRFRIHGVPEFEVRCILDTGATKCCIDIQKIPKEAVENSNYPIKVQGVNSASICDKKLKEGYMIIGETQFRIPYTHCFNMNVCDGVQMLLGCNFIRAQHGGVRIEGNRVTFYRNISHIETITESEFF